MGPHEKPLGGLLPAGRTPQNKKGLSCRGAGAQGALRGLGRFSVPKPGFISHSLRWKGGSWPGPPLLPPQVTDEQRAIEARSWRHEQLSDVQRRVSCLEIRLESGRLWDSRGGQLIVTETTQHC